jgi:uncharacterized repeat protein (TIGR03803 family)
VVFKINVSGRETVLHAFTGKDGETPGDLIFDAAGNLYGTTSNGGRAGEGTIFEITSSRRYKLLYSFCADLTVCPDGTHPEALLMDSSGNLYGTAIGGGKTGGGCSSFFQGCGVVYKLDTAGRLSVLHAFAPGGGQGPSSLILHDNYLYGTTERGGITSGACGTTLPDTPPGCGLVFKLSMSGVETVLHRFSGGGSDGELPAGIVFDSAGNLYGTTISGGNRCAGGIGNRCGIVFKIDASDKETVLYKFKGGTTDGWSPDGGLYLSTQTGLLYGTTSLGGSAVGFGYGTVFNINPIGQESLVYRFSGTPDASEPFAGLIQFGGKFYGTTAFGGTHNRGTVFSLPSS